MQISYDVQLIILGAAIVLVSSVITIFIKDWVSARRKRIERKEEQKEKQDELDKAGRLDLLERGILRDPKVGVMRLPKREEDKPPE